MARMKYPLHLVPMNEPKIRRNFSYLLLIALPWVIDGLWQCVCLQGANVGQLKDKTERFETVLISYEQKHLCWDKFKMWESFLPKIYHTLLLIALPWVVDGLWKWGFWQGANIDPLEEKRKGLKQIWLVLRKITYVASSYEMTMILTTMLIPSY